MLNPVVEWEQTICWLHQIVTFSLCSGKVSYLFVSIGDILAAVINEVVTSFTFYSYLALVLRDERKLALVFEGLRPPLNMLVPTWKSLCSAINYIIYINYVKHYSYVERFPYVECCPYILKFVVFTLP